MYPFYNARIFRSGRGWARAQSSPSERGNKKERKKMPLVMPEKEAKPRVISKLALTSERNQDIGTIPHTKSDSITHCEARAQWQAINKKEMKPQWFKVTSTAIITKLRRIQAFLAFLQRFLMHWHHHHLVILGGRNYFCQAISQSQFSNHVFHSFHSSKAVERKINYIRHRPWEAAQEVQPRLLLPSPSAYVGQIKSYLHGAKVSRQK